jgi:HD-GYP domain-containing protein (c-di-GMP phosphodiesterase class II)
MLSVRTGEDRMIRVLADELTPGMVLAAPIPHPRIPRVALLKAGYRLIPRVIRQLPRYGVRYVWIRHPGFEFLDERLNQAVPECRVQLFHQIKKSFTGIANHTASSFDLNEYRAVISDLILHLVAEKANAAWADRLLGDREELFSHSANVAYLSVVLGIGLRKYIAAERRYQNRIETEDLTNLGIGAMLHDIGKLGLPSAMHGVHECEPIDDLDTYRQHPERGYQALHGRIEATAATVVLHHHQRFSGSGFPAPTSPHAERKLSPIDGHRIHVFSRIVAVTNAIDSLISICHRDNKPTIAALATIHSPALRSRFDPVILLTALRCIPPFAVGACVTLSDGRRAVVIDLNRDRPCQPTVQVLLDSATVEAPAGETVDLAATSDLSIAADGGRPVQNYLYTLPRRRSRKTAAQAQPVPVAEA